MGIAYRTTPGAKRERAVNGTARRCARMMGLLAPMLVPAGMAAQTPSRQASDEMQRIFAESWEASLEDNPLLATSVGDRRYDDRLPTATVAQTERRAARLRGFRERLQRLDASTLPREEQISRDIYLRLAQDELAEIGFRTYLVPITNREGFHVSFPELPGRTPFATAEDYESYTARLRGFREYARQHVDVMRAGIREGFVLPRIVLTGVEETLEPHIVDDATRSLLYAPFTTIPASIPAQQRERLQAAGRDAILTSVVPGYRDFLAFMKEEYLPAARSSVGASELPNGGEFYAHRVRSFTTLDLSPDEVHRTGLREIARIRAEMEEIKRRTGFTGSLADFLAYLRSEPRFYVRTPAELMERTSLVLKRMDGELPRLFGRLPRMPYGVKEIPAYIAPRTTTAYYSRPSGDGKRAGTYWVNTFDLASRPLYEIEALSLHEAVPGHHLQIALQQEMEGMPNFRLHSGFTAFTEGWGLYAESLGKEAGFYTDPYSDFGRLIYDAWRAARLVVDTGIHAKGWTRQQAIDYMLENTGLTPLNVRNEVDRYIAWPGQALAYKTGQMKISALRAEAERALGSRFDVREFHDVVLGSGAVPLTILEENVRRWIRTETSP